MTANDGSAPKRPRGRPKGTTSPEARKRLMRIRLNDGEREKIDRFAEDANLPSSDYVRRRALKQSLKKK